MPENFSLHESSRWRVMVAFAAIYLIWGSTYFAIHVAIETMPPFFMAGIRFLVAGGILYLWMRLRGAPAPKRVHWIAATAIGGLLLLGGNGGVVWAEQYVPTGLAALLIATVPFWMVLLDWLRRDGKRPNAGVITGLALGFIGMALLVSQNGIANASRIDPIGALVLIIASLSWAGGSLLSRRAQLPESPFMVTAMEMLAGGALLFLAGLVTGEWGRFEPGAFSPRSVIALGYLTVFGSLIAFTAYIWLLRVSTPAKISTYAYVNPVVAILLGWMFLGEALTSQTLLAAASIVIAVVVITTYRARPAAETQKIVSDHTTSARREISTEGRYQVALKCQDA